MSADTPDHVRGPVHPNRKGHATFYTKPQSDGYTGGGYELWRSTERRPHTAVDGSEGVYLAHHRLLAVVACYDLETPIEEVTADLAGKDVHHRCPREDRGEEEPVPQVEGVPWDNRPDAIEVLDHARHAGLTNAEKRAYAEDSKRVRDGQVTLEAGCADCGAADPGWRIDGADGRYCLECATEHADGRTIEAV